MAIVDNCVHYWKMDEASGSPKDEVGTLDSGSVTSCTYSESGKINTSFGFNGSAYVSFGDITNFDGLTTMSISCWFKTSSASASQFLVAKENNYYCFEIGMYAGKMRAYFYNGTYAVSGSTYNDGAWHHVVATYDSALGSQNIKLYIDGSSVATANVTGAIPNTTDYFAFGTAARSGNYANKYTGYLDEIGIWNKVLSSSEVTSLYNSGSGLAYPFSSGPDYTKLKINIGDAWKSGAGAQINIGDSWKTIAGMQINIGDAWKTIF